MGVMANIKDLSNTWNNIKEIDLRPLALEAGRSLVCAIVGRPDTGRDALAQRMRSDPHRPEMVVQTPLILADVDSPPDAAGVDVFILLIAADTPDDNQERRLAQIWATSAKPVLVCLLQPQPVLRGQELPSGMEHWANWGQRRVVVGMLEDEKFLLNVFVPALLRLLPGRHLALGRQFPLTRHAVANQLVNDSCFSNAAYALSTGIAEIVPVFDIPLNITDMLVLTKAQAFLVYKLGLALGMSTHWQDYITEFGSVLGSGFLWRQVARQLVGLIPVWGIIPKVAVSYAGTYVVGHVVLQWYLTGRHLNRQQMRQLYSQAFVRGRQLAGKLFKGRLKAGKSKVKQLPKVAGGRVCSTCGKTSSADAQFCQYCGQTLQT